MKYRVIINNFSANYAETWDAESPYEAEQKARARWQAVFGDAAAFRFHAEPIREIDDDER